jgi:hypothetical protein
MFEGLKRSPILVVRNKQNRFDNFFGMKLQKISANISPFAGIIFVNNGFNTVGLSQPIDNELNAFRTGLWVIMEKITFGELTALGGSVPRPKIRVRNGGLMEHSGRDQAVVAQLPLPDPSSLILTTPSFRTEQRGERNLPD